MRHHVALHLGKICAVLAACTLGGCVSNGTLQPDRALFSLDGNYQRYEYAFSIEDTFDRAAAVFREGGYKLDVVDRATGQMSGTRGRTGDETHSEKGLKFYAMVLPGQRGNSILSIKVVQIISRGIPGVTGSKTEVIVADPQMYQYLFRRIETGQQSELPAAQ